MAAWFCTQFSEVTAPLHVLVVMVSASAALLYTLAGARLADVITSPDERIPEAEMEIERRSSTADSGGDDDDSNSVDSLSSVFVPRRVALSLLRSRRHAARYGVASRSGLHCECCVHRCSYNELMGYCRSDSEVQF